MADLEKNIKIGVDLSDLQLGVHEAINSIQGFWSSVEAGSRNSAQSFEMMTSAFQSQSSVIQVGIRDTERFSETFVQVQQTSQVALSSYSRDLATVQKEQENANASAKRWTESTKVVFGLLAQGAPAFFDKFITETINAEKQQAQLSAVLKSTSEAAGWSQERLNGMAASLSKSSVFSSGEITQAQTQLLTYSNVVGQQFPQAMQAVVDMSSRMGTSVTSSAETIGQALNSPSEGLKALADKGVQFTDQQKEMVAQLEATGQVGAAQAVILDALQTSYGGAAVAARDTLGGALTDLKKNFALAMTGDSGSLQGMRESIELLNETLSSETTRAGFQTVISGIAGIAKIAATAISVVGQFANAISMDFKGAQHATLERQFDFAKTELDRLQPRLRLDPDKNNTELQDEAKRLRDTMVRASLEMQKITASMAKQAGVVAVPTIDVPTVEAGTKAVQAQTEAITKNAAQLGATAQASSQAVTQGASASTDAAKNAQAEYERLRDSIQSKIDANKRELEGEIGLTAAQKERAAFMEKLNKEHKNLPEPQKEKLQAQFDNLQQTQADMTERSRGLAALEQERVLRASLTTELEKSAQAYLDGNKSLEQEIELIGKNASERTQIAQARNQEIILIKKAALAEQERQDAQSGTQSRVAIALHEEIDQLERRNELLGMKESAEKADVNLQKLHGQFTQTVQQVEDAFVNGFVSMMNGGKEAWKTFCNTIKTSFFTLVVKELYAAFAKPFVVQLVGSFMGIASSGAGSAAMQAASSSSGLISFTPGASSLGGMFGSFNAGLAGGWTGFEGGLAMMQNGEYLAGGMQALGAAAPYIGALIQLGRGNIGGGIGTAAGAYIGSVFPVVGTALGALLGSVFGSALNGIFGRKLKESGVEGEFGGESGFEGRLFKYYKGGWFRSNKTTYEEMPEEMRSSLGKQFLAVDSSIREMANAVGIGSTALDGFSAKIKVNLKGLSEEEATKKLQDEFQKIADQMGSLVLTSQEYNRSGETQLEALARLALSITSVNAVFETLGITMLDASLASADWASGLLELMGGLENFNAAAGAYYNLYYSDDEKRSRASKVANDGMEERGLDLRVGDVDAKKKYRALVDKAIADRDEELLAWLLQFADDFANGVDAVTASLEDGTNALAAKLQEIQQIREETLSTLGLSMDGLVDGFINEINEGRGAQAGEWLADTIAVGFEQAIYGQAINTIMSSIIDGVITPVVTAAMTGSAVSGLVSGAAIDSMMANARAAAAALKALLSDEAFKSMMDDTIALIRDIGNDVGGVIPKMSTYRPAVQQVTNAYESSTSAAEAAAKAAEKLRDEWSKLIDTMSNEMKRLRGELLGATQDKGAAYYESMFAIKTAQARSGDQDAAAELPSIIQALEALAKASATSQADVLLKQSAWLASLADTRNFLAHKYGVDIGDVKTAEVGAATAGRVVQASGNTALLSALQASSDNPVLVAEVRALRLSLDNHDANRKAEATVVVPAVQQLNKTLRMWDADGMPATRKQEENA